MTLFQDVRYGIRVLLRSPGFLIAAVLWLALGIAMHASRSDLSADLKERGGTGTHGRFHARNLLVLFQVVLSVVALASAGLFLRSLSNAQAVDLGFEHDKLIVLQYDVTSNRYDENRGKQYHRQIVEHVRRVPGVAAITIASEAPLTPPFQRSVFVMSYSVNLRSQEIGIRMALGAQGTSVLWMVLRQGMMIVGIGLAAGLIIAAGVSRLLSGLLYGVGMADLPAFAGTATVLFVVALIANYIRPPCDACGPYYCYPL